jgi:hypothetical protein
MNNRNFKKYARMSKKSIAGIGVIYLFLLFLCSHWQGIAEPIFWITVAALFVYECRKYAKVRQRKSHIKQLTKLVKLLETKLDEYDKTLRIDKALNSSATLEWTRERQYAERKLHSIRIALDESDLPERAEEPFGRHLITVERLLAAIEREYSIALERGKRSKKRKRIKYEAYYDEVEPEDYVLVGTHKAVPKNNTKRINNR